MLNDSDQGRKLKLFFLLSFILIFFLVTLRASGETNISEEDLISQDLNSLKKVYKSLAVQSETMLNILTALSTQNLTSTFQKYEETASKLKDQISKLKFRLS